MTDEQLTEIIARLVKCADEAEFDSAEERFCMRMLDGIRCSYECVEDILMMEDPVSLGMDCFSQPVPPGTVAQVVPFRR
jgi:hypothetical protein